MIWEIMRYLVGKWIEKGLDRMDRVGKGSWIRRFAQICSDFGREKRAHAEEAGHDFIHQLPLHLLWDVERSGLDADQHAAFLICRIMDRGDIEQMRMPILTRFV
jgi:hypothetical protein